MARNLDGEIVDDAENNRDTIDKIDRMNISDGSATYFRRGWRNRTICAVVTQFIGASWTKAALFRLAATISRSDIISRHQM